MGIMDRFRGKIVIESGIYGSVPQNQIEALSSSPLAAPTIAFNGSLSTAALAAQFIFEVTMNRNQSDDTGIESIAKRAVMNYHFEDTAGALLDGALIGGADSGNTSGATAVGVVIPNSTVAGGFGVGRLICTSTGGVTFAVTGTSGGATTGVLVVTLPNGTIAESSQVAFTT